MFPDSVEITITYYYDGDSSDVYNITKLVQGELGGMVFVDDVRSFRLAQGRETSAVST